MKTVSRKGAYKGHRRWVPYAARGLSWAASQAVRYGSRRLSNAFSGSSTKKASEMAPLTAEKDVRVVYRKRRMPRGKRRRYVRSLKRWRSMKLKSEPSRIHSLVFGESKSALGNTSRYFGAFMGLCANNTYDTDLSNIWANIEPGAISKLRQAMLRIDHMSLNCVVRNTTTGGVTGGIMDVDVYKVIVVRDIPLARWSGLFEDMHAALKSELRQATGMDVEVNDAGIGIPTLQTNAGTNSTNQAVGDLLFNNPPLLRYFRIVKHWKVQLGAGQTMTFNMRSARNRAIKRDECVSGEGAALAAKAYFTEGYVFNINGRFVPSSSPPPGSFEPVSCVIEQFVRYNYKPLSPNSSDTLVYDGA